MLKPIVRKPSILLANTSYIKASGNQETTCPLCHAVFKLTKHQNNFKSHMVKKHQAKFCNYKADCKKLIFFSDKLFTQHLNKCKTIKCNHCDKKFTRNGTRNRHIKEVHQKIKSRTLVECEECNKVFATPYNLNRHFENVHLNPKPIHTKEKTPSRCEVICTFCQKLCANFSGLREHNTKSNHKPLRKYQCAICLTTDIQLNKIHKCLEDYIINCKTCREAFDTMANFMAHKIAENHESAIGIHIQNETAVDLPEPKTTFGTANHSYRYLKKSKVWVKQKFE